MNSKIDLIVERIKNRRKELGYSYQVLADKTNMSKSTLQRYETGAIKNIPLDKLEVLANALEISPTYLLGIECESPLLTDEIVQDSTREYEIFTPEEKKLIYSYRKLNKEAKNIIDYVIKNENLKLKN